MSNNRSRVSLLFQSFLKLENASLDGFGRKTRHGDHHMTRPMATSVWNRAHKEAGGGLIQRNNQDVTSLFLLVCHRWMRLWLLPNIVLGMAVVVVSTAEW